MTRKKIRTPADILLKMVKRATNKEVPHDLSINDDYLYKKLYKKRR